ncbi:uncharacterized protein LOC116294999 [Actinia tenebrosa]|uniref:Uncharacterized protein LOC116294999 n=1 Tax=Actinia tenebrosa TaxID=6105 RepID=A0A6P8HT29_ACTTE|nr:uncharacterized protein LOC116294999 [Actinia tenebrosa]
MTQINPSATLIGRSMRSNSIQLDTPIVLFISSIHVQTNQKGLEFSKMVRSHLLVYFCMFWTIYCPKMSASVTLSPESWPEGEYERFERLNLIKDYRPKPLAFSSGKGMVAGTTNAFAVHVGMDALRKGGNAMDACLSTAITEVALAAGSYVSYTGVTNILYYDRKTDKVYSLDGGWNIPSHVPPDIPPVHSQGPNGATVLIPGFIAGVTEAAKRFAKFPLSTLLEPAIYFTEKGFKLPYWLYGSIYVNYNSKTLLRTPQGRAKFTNPVTGKPYAYQELFRQPLMAEFLKNISASGKDYFYKGFFGRTMAAIVQEEQGTITAADMANYQATWNEPANTTYSGHQIYSSGSDWGGAELVEKLNLMELAGLSDSESSYLSNSSKLFWLGSISRLSFFASWYGKIVKNGLDILEKSFGADFSLNNRKTKENAKKLWEKIRSPEKMRQANAIIKKLLGGTEEKRAVNLEEYFGSDGVVALDTEGNACAMIHTINSLMWGTGLFLQGNALPHSAAIFKSYVKNTEPGTRLPNGLQPVLALKESGNDRKGGNGRKPVLAVSVVGQSYAMNTNQFITSILDSYKTPREAVNTPTFLLPSTDSFYQDVRMEEFAIAENILNDARALGLNITEVSYKVSNGALGLGVIVTADGKGNMYGCSNADRWGYSEGV